jgi:hypothetical protein
LLKLGERIGRLSCWLGTHKWGIVGINVFGDTIYRCQRPGCGLTMQELGYGEIYFHREPDERPKTTLDGRWPDKFKRS